MHGILSGEPGAMIDACILMTFTITLYVLSVQATVQLREQVNEICTNMPWKLGYSWTVKQLHAVINVDIGKREFSSGLTFVACSRVRQLQDLLFIPSVPFQRLASLANSQRIAQRKAEDQRFMPAHGFTIAK